MNPNPYLWPQLSGPIAQAVVTGIQNAFQEPLPLIQYWSTLSILTAQDVDGTLNYVGALSGYPRPLVGDIFYNALLLILVDANLPPTNSTTYGLSDAATWPSGPGGQLYTALPISTNEMPATWYQQMLPIVAQAEYYGLSLQIVDILAAWANTNGGGTGYTILRDSYNNIVVVFTSYTDPRTLYIANLVVQALETLPLVVFEEP